jgi:site-specific DNA recombinase
MKVALYARYSSDNQRDASIEDQLRLCRLHAERQGWTVVDSYSDRAISGATLLRPGIQELIQDAIRGRFTVVLAEAMDRLSRDQEDIAGLFKRMNHADVKIVTLAEGEVTHLHVGLKGTMNALFLKDLAEKTRRGMRGRIEGGKSGGGLCYGYGVVKQFAPNGEPIRGDRTINETEANVVRRIFKEYLAGKSSRTIAWELNEEGIGGPQGAEWGQSTIHGSPKRGVGILNNELYVGRLVWNRLRYLKDPDTGKRVSRLNPESEWVIQDVPELRIVEQAVWDTVKERQKVLAYEPPAPGQNTLNERRRPKHLFAGLVKCGRCGGGYTKISEHLLGCATARDKGTCDNRLNIRRDVLEASVLAGLRTHLMEPGLFKEFCEEFTREVNRLRIERGADLAAMRDELPRITRELEKIMDLYLKDAMPIDMVKERSTKLEARRIELTRLLENAEEPPALLHPNMAETYRQRVTLLHESLRDDDEKDEAAAAFRTLVEQVTLIPNKKELGIVLRGDLAAMLTFAANKKNPDFLVDAGLLHDLIQPGSLAVVAGNSRRLRVGERTPVGPAFMISQESVLAGPRNQILQ